MTRRGFENRLVVVLFVLVLVAFSFAQRDSKKLDRLYTTAWLIKKSADLLSDVGRHAPLPK